MTKRATHRPGPFQKPSHWKDDPPPTPQPTDETEEMSPTRYGDWVKKGIAIDF
jgi:hypothetical protein